MHPTLESFRRCGPDWRLCLARRLCSATATHKRSASEHDPLVLELSQYFVLERDPHGRTVVARRFPRIDAALELNADSSIVRTLKLLAIAGAASDDVAERTGVAADTFDVWKNIFFD